MVDLFHRPTLDGISSSRRRLERGAEHRQWRRRRYWLRLLIALTSVVLAVGFLIPQVISTAWQLAPFWRTGRYLVLLQNDAELRPTGGFIGSYAVVTIHRGGWFTTQVQTNIYKIDNAFTATHNTPPPDGLRNVTQNWSLRDSNWAVDFPEASRTVAQFYHDETGDSVDGVIGVTAHAGQELVRLLGSVPLADGTRLTASNFYETLSYQVEKGYFLDPTNRAINEPKVVIAQLIKSVAYRLLPPWNLNRAAGLFQNLIDTKQVTFSFFDQSRQRIVEERGWANHVDSASVHYLALNNANIGGMKSSLNMTQAVSLDIADLGTGPATYQLTLARTHHGTGDWPDHANTNITRVVLPSNAILIGATLDGEPIKSISTELANGRTVIGFQIDTQPGTTRTLVATFQVPIDRNLAPTFVWQKQSGVTSDDATVRYNNRELIHDSLDRDTTIELHR